MSTIKILYVEDETTHYPFLAKVIASTIDIDPCPEYTMHNDVFKYDFVKDNNSIYTLFCCQRKNEAISIIESNDIAISFIDHHLLNGETGIDVGRQISERYEKKQSKIFQVMLTAYNETMIETLRAGVFSDFIHKADLNKETLSGVFARFEMFRVLHKKIEQKDEEIHLLTDKNKHLEKQLHEYIRQSNDQSTPQKQENKQILKMIGESNSIKLVDFFAERYAATNDNVLIIGESGTGKELVANNIHYKSSRANMTFLTLNCAAFPEELVDSELFGHVKGAFTGAIVGKTGLLQQADGGTVFLDEIDRMSLKNQAKLLRFLEDHYVRKSGDEDKNKKKVDVRIIAAIKPASLKIGNGGMFKILPDLYGRLQSLFPIIPPLKDRKEDIPLLVNYFIDKIGREYCRKKTNTPNNDDNLNKIIEDYGKYKGNRPFFIIDDTGMGLLKREDWERNHVRELQRFIENLFTVFIKPGFDKKTLSPGSIINNEYIEMAFFCYNNTVKEISDEKIKNVVDSTTNPVKDKPGEKNKKIEEIYNKKDIDRIRQRLDIYVEALKLFAEPNVTVTKLQPKAHLIYQEDKGKDKDSQKYNLVTKFSNENNAIGNYFKDVKNYEIDAYLYNEYNNEYEVLNKCNRFPFVNSYKKKR